MTMYPQLWTRDPMTVDNEWHARHAPDRLPNAFMWAVWTAEGSHYLEGMDGASFPPAPDARGDLLDMSHVRWATGDAITAIDLCAATTAHIVRCSRGKYELSLRSFDPNCAPQSQAAVARRRALLTPAFLGWVDDTLADPRYVDLHDARNPFTHAWLQRHVVSGGGGHEHRTKFEVLGTGRKVNARDMVVDSAALALDRVRAFVAVVDGD